MIRDLAQRYFKKIEATVQISYGVSLAHHSEDDYSSFAKTRD
jgi:hypothetical protein